MPACTVCQHPKRSEIDNALRGNKKTHQEIVRQFKLKVHTSALSRHKNKHLLAEGSVAAARERAFLGDADVLFEIPSDAVDACVLDLKAMVALAREFGILARRALRSNHQRDAIMALTQLRSCHESIAKYKLEKAVAPKELRPPVFLINYRVPGETDEDVRRRSPAGMYPILDPRSPDGMKRKPGTEPAAEPKPVDADREAAEMQRTLAENRAARKAEERELKEERARRTKKGSLAARLDVWAKLGEDDQTNGE